MTGLGPLRTCIGDLADAVTPARDDGALLADCTEIVRALVGRDGWLPDEFARVGTDRYQQHLLFCDARAAFSVVAFVWGPGQATPVHDHRVWGVVGVLRGAEVEERYERTGTGLEAVAGPRRLEPGDVAVLSPRTGDLHRVENACSDRPSVSIHVYGADIGAVRRVTYDADGRERPFTSGYSNLVLPNPWGVTSAPDAPPTDRR